MSNGQFLDKSAEEAYEFLEELAENAKSWEVTAPSPLESRGVQAHSSGKLRLNENDDLSARVSALSRKLELLESKKVNVVNEREVRCVICEVSDHSTDECPTVPAFKEVLYGQTSNTNTSHNFPKQFHGQTQAQFGHPPLPNQYHPGLRNHPNFSWRNDQPSAPYPSYSNPSSTQGQAQGSSSNVYQPPHRKSSLEDTLQQFMQGQIGINNQTAKHQEQTNRAIEDIRNQLTKLVQNQSHGEKGRLPSQTIQNPQGQVHMGEVLSEKLNQEHVQSITTLRSGRVIEKPDDPRLVRVNEDEGMVFREEGESSEYGERREKNERKIEDEKKRKDDDVERFEKNEKSQWRKKNNVEEKREENKEREQVVGFQPPFPSRLNKSKKEMLNSEIFEVFKQVRINLPLLDAIKQVPSYSKFLKDLCTVKRRVSVKEKAFMTEQVSAILQSKTPPKYNDPGCPTIACVIGEHKVKQALLDLGASVNLLPYTVYQQLGLGELKPTRVTLQLADRSVKIPRGILEDVLIQVDNFCYPVDFIVLDTQPTPQGTIPPVPVILGRPFLATTNAIINCRNGLMKISFGNLTAEMNIFRVTKQPIEEEEDIREVDLIHSITEEYFESEFIGDPLEKVLTLNGGSDYVDEVGDEEVREVLEWLDSSPIMSISQSSQSFEPIPPSLVKPVPSLEKPPKPDRKPLPSELKYAFLGEDESYPVVISSKLTNVQEKRLVELLRNHKKAIGWTIADLHGISPLECTHSIYLEEGAKPVRQPQRRLNPNMKEVVKGEVLKLLDAGIIYPISDSQWVSPTQVVPKKSGVTVIKNEENELVPTRIQTGWRMCIDYRKLNTVTRKDHFPLPFLDQVLERVSGRPFYCFLDGYSGYNQIEISLTDQHKTTFTCPFGTFAYRRMPFGLCNAPATFQRCMMSIFCDMVEDFLEVFMDDFSVYGDSFDLCLENLGRVLKRCEEKCLVLN